MSLFVVTAFICCQYIGGPISSDLKYDQQEFLYMTKMYQRGLIHQSRLSLRATGQQSRQFIER